MFARPRTCTRTLLLTFAVGVSGLSGEGKVRHTREGYSILGNGNLTVVYSDDPRISAKTNAMGVQHLYFSDYTAHYVAATSFKLADEGGKTLAGTKASQVGMKNFFTVQTQTRLANGGSGT